MKVAGLGKQHKLCSATAIEHLFDGRAASDTMLAYPLRAVWAHASTEGTAGSCHQPLQFLISIPKKRLRHAVDRVKMRRRVREAYRLQRVMLVPSPNSPAFDTDTTIHLAFVYIANKVEPYARVEKAVCKILTTIFPK